MAKAITIGEHLGFESKLLKRDRGPYAHARKHPLGLTRRELEVLAWVVQGSTNKEIGRALSRSPRTIGQHVSALLSKLGVGNRVEAILRVQQEPWILGEQSAPATGVENYPDRVAAS